MEFFYLVDSLSLPLLFGLVGIYPVPIPAGYSSVSSSCLYCCVWGGLSVFCVCGVLFIVEFPHCVWVCTGGISLPFCLVYIAVFGVAFLYFGSGGSSLLWRFLTVGGVGRVACQGFLVREACVSVLVGGAGLLLSGVQ